MKSSFKLTLLLSLTSLFGFVFEPYAVLPFFLGIWAHFFLQFLFSKKDWIVVRNNLGVHSPSTNDLKLLVKKAGWQIAPSFFNLFSDKITVDYSEEKYFVSFESFSGKHKTLSSNEGVGELLKELYGVISPWKPGKVDW